MSARLRQWRITSSVTGRLHTVVETTAYLAAAGAYLSEVEREEIVNRVDANPTEGVSLGGGIRKMRVAASGRGKRGGTRIVYLFGGDNLPVFLLTAFSKNEKADLMPMERQTLIAVGKRIAARYGS